jgi:hypothetical protein
MVCAELDWWLSVLWTVKLLRKSNLIQTRVAVCLFSGFSIRKSTELYDNSLESAYSKQSQDNVHSFSLICLIDISLRMTEFNESPQKNAKVYLLYVM